MLLKELKDKDIKKLSAELAPKLVENKLFKFLCPESDEREDFIDAYLNYNLPRWLSRGDFVLTDSNFDVLVVLSSPRRASHKFSGKGAKKLKKFPSAPSIFYYRGNLSYITHLIAPRNKRLKVMAILDDSKHDDVVFELVNEAIALKYKYDFNLMYESLSRRLIGSMQQLGFIISYQKQFGATGYMETIMMYNK